MYDLFNEVMDAVLLNDLIVVNLTCSQHLCVDSHDRVALFQLSFIIVVLFLLELGLGLRLGS